MTISSTTVVTRTNTNGVTHTFNFGHPFLDRDDLDVYLVTLADWTVAPQTRDTHYTVSQNGNEHLVGGTITFINDVQVATAPADGKVCVILRKPDAIQDFNPSSEKYYPVAAGETALDRIYQMIQLVQYQHGRSIHLADAHPEATLTIPDPTARANKALQFDSSGNLTVGVTGASVLAGSEAAQAAAEAAASAAGGYASTATVAASAAGVSANLAEAWAVKIDGIVNGEDYSSKAYAIGGSGVTGAAGSAKEWANRTDANVDGTDPSAKSWALGGTPTTGVADRGAAKDWATKVDGTADAAEFSAKAYAVGGTGVSGGAGAAKEWSEKTDGAVNGGGDGFSAKAWALGGSSVSETADRGAAKEWAIKTDDPVDTSEFSAKGYALGMSGLTGSLNRGGAKDWAIKVDGPADAADFSAKAYAVGGTGVTDVSGAAKEWATKGEDSTVDGVNYSAYHWAKKAEEFAAQAAALTENPGLTFNFDASTSESDPGDGELRINHGTYGSATFLFIDNLDYFGNTISPWLDIFDDTNTASKGIVMIRDVSDPTAFLIARIGGAIIDGTGYRKVPIAPIASGASAFSGLISVMFVPGVDFPTSIDFNWQVDADLDVTGDLTVGVDLDVDGNATVLGYGAFLGGSMPTQFADPGVYVGIESNGNAQFNIISTGTYGYFDIGGINEDYKFRFLTEIASGNTSLTALGSLLLNGTSNGSATDFTVPDEAYGSGWNGSLEVPTKNAVYDRIQLFASVSNGEGSALIGIADAGGYFSGSTVESALQALGQSVAALDQAIVLKGNWDASGGSFPGSGAAQAGWKYIVSVGGTVDGVTFAQNDTIVAIADNASTSTYASNWFKQDFTDQVLSVAGKTGTVTLQVADITDMSSNGRSLTQAANYAAMRTLLDLEAGTDFYSISAADALLANKQPLDELLTEIAALSTAPGADRGLFYDHSGTAIDYFTAANGLEFSTTNLQMTTNQRTKSICVTLGTIGTSLTAAAIYGYWRCDFSGTITKVTALADQTGSVVVDIWKDTYANYPPTNSDSITSSAPVTITTGIKSEDSTLTGWTTSITAGDTLGFNVDSVTSIQQVTIIITVLCT